MSIELPGHVQWLLDNRTGLADALARGGVGLEAGDALAVMMAADPSPGHHAVQWLCDSYMAGGYLWEDLVGGPTSKAGDTLALFAQHRAGLPRHQRNLEDYASLAGLWSALAPLLEAGQSENAGDEPGARAARRMARASARADSLVLMDSDDLVVAVPQTQAASCWWGQGTRWCTAARRNNMFDTYHNNAALVVVVMPKVAYNATLQRGAKLQLHVHDGDIQFMDAADSPVNSRFIGQNWSLLEPVLTWAALEGCDVSRLVPPNLWQGALAQAIVARDGRNLQRVQFEHRTHEVCLAAVASDGTALDMVPAEHRSAEIYLAAVSNYADVLKRVPPHLRDEAMCWAAVKGSGATLEHVPHHLRTYPLCLAAVSTCAAMLEHVPPQLVDNALLLAAVRQSPDILLGIEEHLRTPQLYWAGVSGSGRMLEHVPLELHTDEMRLAAARATPSSILAMDRNLWTPELLMAAVQSNGLVISRIAEDYLYPELCTAAVLNYPSSYTSIPQHMRTPELSRLAVSLEAKLLQDVPGEMVSYEMCRIAVTHSHRALKYVPDHLLDHDLCMQAAQMDGCSIQSIPEKFWTHDILVPICARFPWRMGTNSVSEQCNTESFLTDVVRLNGFALLHIDDDDQTLEMCIAAVQQDPGHLWLVCPRLNNEVKAACTGVLAEVESTPGRVWDTSGALGVLERLLADARTSRDAPGEPRVDSPPGQPGLA